MSKALIIVDMQKDFCKGGSLEVPGAEKIIPYLNECIKIFSKRGFLIILTRDWHPFNHSSFKEYGGKWPSHCVENTEGAKFHEDLIIPKNSIVISKGIKKDKDGYSGFEDTELEKILKEKNVKEIFVCGVATEYCVRATVLDGVKKGFKVFLIEDCCKGVNKQAEDEVKKEIVLKGANKIRLKNLQKIV